MPETEDPRPDGPPRLFISYRWTSPSHEDWVLGIASSLRADGVDVILDKWHLKEGHDTYAFMERMVTDATVSRCLLVCDSGYVERANSREGGVGTEAQIVSAEVYSKVDQTKFAAAVVELDAEGKPLLPAYLKRLYFDFSAPEAYSSRYEKVLRWCFDKPFHAIPAIGKPPAFLNDNHPGGISFSASATALKTQRRISGTNVGAAASNVLEDIAAEAPSLCLSLAGKSEPDELLVQAIAMADNMREQAYVAIDTIFRGSGSDESKIDIVHSFIERVSSHWDEGPESGTFTKIDNDALRYLAHSLLIGTIAICMKVRKFSLASVILSTPYYRANRAERVGSGVTYLDFRPYLIGLEEVRNRRLNLNRISVHADYLLEAHNHSFVTFPDFLEADFTLYLRSLVDRARSENQRNWYPISLVYLEHAYGSFPTYVRAASAAFYARFAPLIGGLSADLLRSTLAPVLADPDQVVRFDYRSIEVSQLGNLQALATMP